ncbi:MAG TPA: DUF3617 domain-containing protein [Rhizomicrobium sp.]|jgi:hypothetical protein|nr:DUF3617 domain-containing protein [Rhizomicrobium sp.]
MFSRKSIVRIGLGLSVLALPAAALAGHGKVGLWEITTHMSMPGMAAQIPPEAMARMKAMGMQMPGNQTFTTQHCMTAEEVAQDKPPPIRNTQDCAMSNYAHDAHSVSVDMVCKGENMIGQGRVSVAYDSDSHYSGSFTFTGTAHGHPANMTDSFEGKWVSADCGSAK